MHQLEHPHTIAIAAVIIIPAQMTNRAMVKVVRIFRDQEATDVWSAKTAIQLGIGPRGFFDRLMDPRRDYKPITLKVFKKYGIVRQVGKEKFYLNEKFLNDFCHQNENRLKICSLDFPKKG